MDITYINPIDIVAMAVTLVPALTAKAIDEDAIDAKQTVSKKMKNVFTSTSKPSKHVQKQWRNRQR